MGEGGRRPDEGCREKLKSVRRRFRDETLDFGIGGFQQARGFGAGGEGVVDQRIYFGRNANDGIGNGKCFIAEK